MARRLVIALTLIASLALGLAADAGARRIHRLHPPPRVHKAASKKAKPTVRKVSPLSVKVGQQLSITGRNFVPKKTKVYFLRSGGGVAIVKPDVTTKTHLVVTVPNGVLNLLKTSGTKLLPTRFSLRIYAKRYGPVTPKSLSPVISASYTPGGGGGGGTDTPGSSCAQGGAADTDGDGLTDQTESDTTHTDPCVADTDGDGVPDGYEYQSALDMNETVAYGDPAAPLPYPGKRPWPNPLDPTDAVTDHDGDGLTMTDEYLLNKYVGGPKVGVLQYSDGKQRSQDVAAPVAPELDYRDLTWYAPSMNNGVLSDDERDADGDGLGNWDELYGRMTSKWWDSAYGGSDPNRPKESAYINAFPGVSPIDPDTDGDGVNDGNDDQDHDGLPNKFEISRPWDWNVTYISTAHDGVVPDSLKVSNGGSIPDAVAPNPWARVQPFNPCKPVWSKTCNLHPPFGYYGQDEDWIGPDPANYGATPGATGGARPTAPWMFDSNDFPVANGE